MKILLAFAAVCLVAPVGAASASDLPPGVYSFVVSLRTNATCLGYSTTGFFVYPGPGGLGTEIDFLNNGSPTAIEKLPPVPENGLAGWGPTSPAPMEFLLVAYQNPQPTYPGDVSFSTKQITPANWFITFNISEPDYGCSGTIVVDAYRSGRAL